MTNPNEDGKLPAYPRFFADLTEEERNSIEECIRALPKVFCECESYLRQYEANEVTVFKLLQAMNVVGGAIGYTRNDLIKRHKLPNSLYSWLSPKV